jgi:microcystin degradation protein MlrC
MLRALARSICYGKLGTLTSPLTQGTAAEPMQGLIARAEAIARQLDLERISLLPGFPYSDVGRTGFCVVAVAREDKAQAALAAVSQTIADVRANLDRFDARRPSPKEAVRLALEMSASPIILADVADNIGGGSPGDGTVLLGFCHAAGAS